MDPNTHLIGGVFTGLLLLKLNILTLDYAIILVLVTFLIDLDHVINFIWKTKSFNIKSMLDDGYKRNEHVRKTWFHYKKGRVLIILLTIVIMQIDFSLGISIFIGYFLHMTLDYFSKKYIDHIKPRKKQNKLRLIVELIINCVFIIGIIILL